MIRKSAHNLEIGHEISGALWLEYNMPCRKEVAFMMKGRKGGCD